MKYLKYCNKECIFLCAIIGIKQAVLKCSLDTAVLIVDNCVNFEYHE